MFIFVITMDKSINIKIITTEEFRSLVVKHMLHEWERAGKEDVVEYCILEGIPKFDKGNVKNFLQDLQKACFIYFDPVAVEFGDNEFLWIVSGCDAILVKKQK
jgi:hypothetical protein